MWNTELYNVGVVKAKKNHNFEFKFDGDLIPTEITTSCGCVNVGWNNKTKVLSGSITPNSVPQHIKDIDRLSYHTVKTIEVVGTLGNVPVKYTLSVRAEVHD